VLLVLWAGFSLFSTVLHWLFGDAAAGRLARFSGRSNLEEIVVEDNDSPHRIAVIDVQGQISGDVSDTGGRSMVTLIQEQLKAAELDKSVKAVLLRVDSPGGEMLATDEIYRAIQSFQKKSQKPVVAFLGGLAASGGYYVSVPCQWIVAHELTITGSIGVIMHSYNYRALLDKVGVRPVVFKSGKFKDMLSGEKSQSDISLEEEEMMRALIQQSFDKFKSVVAEGRRQASEKNHGDGTSLRADWESLADGRILSGKEAFQKGFVDELGDFKQAVTRTLKLAGIPNANLIRYQPPWSLADMVKWFVKSDAPSVKLDLGLDLPKLRSGRLYFLAPAFVQ
jgi:protease-4